MKTILKSSIFEEGFFTKKYPKDFEVVDLIEFEEVFKNEKIEGVFNQIQLNGAFIEILEITNQINHDIEIHQDFPLFKLHFELDGNCEFSINTNSSFKFKIPKGHCNLFYIPNGKGKFKFNTPKRKAVEIIFSETYLERVIGDAYQEMFSLLEASIIINEPFLLWKKSQVISIDLINIIDEIINCKYNGCFKKPYLEAKIKELLIVLLSKSDIEESKIQKTDIVKEDYDKISELEDYIKSNLNKTLTINELAVLVGMNTSKLKQQFKIVYNSTIFKYITEQRMLKAKELIMNDNYSITEASYKVGYKNPQHFTVAFKKLYGYLPSKLIKF